MEDLQVCSNWEDIADNTAVLDKQLEKLRLEKGNKNKQSPSATSSSGGGGEEPKIRILSRDKSNQNKANDRPLLLPSSIILSSGSAAATNSTEPVILLDSTREESLRSQYVPPEPRITLLTRPKASKASANGPSGKSKTQQPVKTLEQREKEYMEARKRILGDVQFSDPEEEEQEEGEKTNGLSPAEVLKQKVAQAMGQEVVVTEKEKNPVDNVSDGADAEAAGGSGTTAAGQGQTKSKSRKKREKFKTPHVESPRQFPVSKVEAEFIIRQPRGPDGTSGFHR